MDYINRFIEIKIAWLYQVICFVANCTRSRFTHGCQIERLGFTPQSLSNKAVY